MKNKLFVIYFLYFLSGFCALNYELIWLRKLTLMFGSTSFAITLILAIFFAGFAIGSYIFSNKTDINYLRTYGFVEIGIGIMPFFGPILMGATFPLLTSYFKKITQDENKIAVLYFINTIGGVVGIIMTTFLLINTFGVVGTLLFTMTINIFIGIVAIKLSKNV